MNYYFLGNEIIKLSIILTIVLKNDHLTTVT